MRPPASIAGVLLVTCFLAPRAGARPGDDPAPAPKEKPAEITQVWPNHSNGAELPIADQRDTNPHCPTGGRMWRWHVVPPRPLAGSSPPVAPRAGDTVARRVCRLEIVPTRRVGGAWTDDEEAHLAGELSISLQTRDGRDFWESDSTRGAWWTGGCARALPETGFTFEVSVTKKEMAKARIERVRFRVLGGGNASSPPTTPPSQLASIDVWTDPFGVPRTVPLTAPVTSVGLAPHVDGTRVVPAGVGVRGIVIVRGAQAVVDVRDAGAAGTPFVVYASLERDVDGDDPSPSGLRATRAALPEDRHVRVQASSPALDAAGKGSFVIGTPDEEAAVGFTFYVQAGVGPDAASGLSCALACTVVASLADYDGDGRPNAEDAAPLDPAR